MKFIDPDELKAPAGPYSHAILVDPGKQWLFATGQVALRKDGTIPEGIDAQARLVWENVGHILRAARMDVSHIVKTGVYLTSADFGPRFNEARNAFLGSHRPATTAVIVAGLANPRYLVEVDVVAAR